MAKTIHIHCIRLQREGDWAPEEIQTLRDIHEARGCPPAGVLWIEKDDLEPGRYIFIEMAYPDKMDGKSAQSLQGVIQQVWDEVK